VNLDGTCISAGTGQAVAIGPNNTFYDCPYGCAACLFSAANTIVCTTAEDGYSIVGGVIIVCDSSCKACSGNSSTSCTACYSSLVLVGGSCKTCADPHAITCLPGNPAYSLTCTEGFTAAFVTLGNTTIGGVCVACADNCIQCDASGPGKCDKGKCSVGFVKIVGTQNCTACLGGCPSCSCYNPGQCLSCLDGQYWDSSSSKCQPCDSSCKTCTSSSNTNCTSCQTGYSLVNGSCYINPSNCVGLNS
jgi:hypothetical protein